MAVAGAIVDEGIEVGETWATVAEGTGVAVAGISVPVGNAAVSDGIAVGMTVAVAWRFIMHNENGLTDQNDYPALAALSARAEVLPEFQACPIT